MSRLAAMQSWVAAYIESLKQTPSLLLRRTFMTKTFEEMVASAQLSSKNSMKRTLGVSSLLLLCLGNMIGGGIFILTGLAASLQAGPAVTISYFIGGVLAVCTGLTYCELAADYPLSGASFNYVLGVWGEFPAFVTVLTIVIDILIAIGAAARGWSSYLAALCNHGGELGFLVHSGSYELDFVAFGFVILVTLVVIAGTRHATWINTVLKLVMLLTIILVLAFTFPHAHRRNWSEPHGYFPYGARGVFEAAAFISLSYGGYSASANLAEEAVNPRRDVPISILAAIGICMVAYLLMCMAITLALPYNHIAPFAPFSILFKSIPGWHWATYLISVGALIGVGTVILVAMLTTTREALVMARHNLIPQWLAYVNKTTGTPIRIITIFGTAAALVALLTSFETLAKMTNVGALFVMSIVAGVALWRRYAIPHSSSDYHIMANIHAFIRLAFLIGFSIAFTALWCARVKWGFYVGFGLPVIASALSFYTLPQIYKPMGFTMPLVPVVAGFTIFSGIFLIGSLGGAAIWRFSIVVGVCIVTYVIYGVHACNAHDKEVYDYINRLPTNIQEGDDLSHEKLQADLTAGKEIALPQN